MLTPLPGKIRPPVASQSELPIAIAGAPPAPMKKPAVPVGLVATNIAPAGLDKSTWRKFAAGRLAAAGRLDLHGYTASRAHYEVTRFLQHARAEKIRCVEIITGKGEVLARELPLWLNAAPLRLLILAMAHPQDGNTGAVRILLKRSR